jgi:signal transduction histidine kinase
MAVENLDLRTGGSEESREAREAISRLTRLIDDLLHVVRLESGTAHPATERVACNAILEAAVARFGEALAEHTFQVEMPRSEWYVEVDPAQITEALGLGLENSARYSPAGSRVRLSATRLDGSIMFRVEDSGPGIPAADRGRALEKFVRLPGTEAPGSGLGLYIARTLVEMNGGTVSLGTTPLGGTSFEIKLAAAP